MSVNALVVGSLNADRVQRVATLPTEGETLSSRSLEVRPGGKGANQAVALSRLGCTVEMAGSVGDDAEGRALVSALGSEGVGTANVTVSHAEATGSATVIVDEAGDNVIIVHPGANGLAPEVPLAPVDLALFQLELPGPVVQEAISRIRPFARRIVLNAAPAHPVSTETLSLVDVLVVNQHEAAVMSGSDDPDLQLERLRGMVRELAVITQGRDGGILVADGPVRWAAAPVGAVVDTTGAGDCFVAALATALAEGADPARAAAWAAGAAAVAVGRPGAQAAMPRRSDLPVLAV